MPPVGHGADPFHTVASMVGRMLLEVHHLQTAGISGDDGAPRRVPALLASLDKQLAALEGAADAMSRAPDRFGLSLGAARARRAVVDDLRQCAADAARASGLGGGGAGGLDEMDYTQRVVHHIPNSIKAGIYYQRQLADKAVGYRAVERNTRRTASARGVTPDSSSPGGGGGGAPGGGAAARGDQDGGAFGGADGSPAARGGGEAGRETVGELDRYVQEQMERQDRGDGKDQGPVIIAIDPGMGADFCKGGLQPPAQAVPTSRGDLHLFEGAGGSYLRLRLLRRRAHDALAAAQGDRQLQAIVALSMVLVVLVVLMFV